MTREEARRLFPFAAQKADELRAVFGPGVKLMYAKENGREIGKRAAKQRGRGPAKASTYFDRKSWNDGNQSRAACIFGADAVLARNQPRNSEDRQVAHDILTLAIPSKI